MNLHFEKGPEIASTILLLLLVSVCAYTDLKFRKIYNKITFPCILLGLLLGFLAGFPHVFLNRLLGFGIAFGLFMMMFLSGYMGGGDVKLAGAIGALAGFPFIIDAVFFGILAGGAYAIVYLLAKKKLRQNLKSVFLFIYSVINPWRQTHSLKHEDSLKIPYGFCIALGTVIAFIVHHTASIQCYFLGY
jgi:prepilin peptidase CpaA